MMVDPVRLTDTELQREFETARSEVDRIRRQIRDLIGDKALSNDSAVTNDTYLTAISRLQSEAREPLWLEVFYGEEILRRNLLQGFLT